VIVYVTVDVPLFTYVGPKATALTVSEALTVNGPEYSTALPVLLIW
jgi:hypothetical protein